VAYEAVRDVEHPPPCRPTSRFPVQSQVIYLVGQSVIPGRFWKWRDFPDLETRLSEFGRVDKRRVE
jgi:hypothetical protein